MVEKNSIDGDRPGFGVVPVRKSCNRLGVSMAKNERKRSLVDAPIQGALLLRAVFHWTFLIVGAFVVLFVWEVLTGDPHQSFSGQLQATWSRYSPCFIILLVLLPAVVHDTLKLSNRFAGPLFRLRRSMQGLVDGQPVQPVRLRNRDFCQDLAKNFNIILERIQSAECFHSDHADSRPAPEQEKVPAA